MEIIEEQTKDALVIVRLSGRVDGLSAPGVGEAARGDYRTRGCARAAGLREDGLHQQRGTARSARWRKEMPPGRRQADALRAPTRV